LDATPDKGLSTTSDTQDTVLQERVIKNVNVRHLEKRIGETKPSRVSIDDLAKAMALSEDMLHTFGDQKSKDYYTYAATKLIDYEQDIRFLMAQIKEDNPQSRVKNLAAIFVTTDKDVGKLADVFTTKEDLKRLVAKEDLKILATKEDLNELAGDVVRVEKKVEEVDQRLNQMDRSLSSIPTRDELPALLEKTFEFVTLKAEHERMKKIIHDKLNVEV
jgi:hypothetical protein